MDESFGHIPLLDAIDLDILMHKDAHFSGNFPLMIEYYENEGVGVMPDFDLDRIKELYEIENSLGASLSESLLPLPARQMIDRSKKMYHDLRSVYEKKHDHVACSVSDLILTEDEFPEKEINELAKHGQKSYAAMIHIIESSDFYDPLFPGYGRTPIFAAIVLEHIKNPDAIKHLFSALGQENFFTDDAIIKALVSFGQISKDFLLKRLVSEPFTKENVYAITALTTLEDDEEVAKVALMLLHKKELQKNENFSRYLIFACSGLKHENDRLDFTQIKDSLSSSGLKRECDVIIKNWM